MLLIVLAPHLVLVPVVSHCKFLHKVGRGVRRGHHVPNAAIVRHADCLHIIQ
ncbi:hypothetical protein M2351_004481 [Azospirillum canadense]|nr:hypothetical protein [Azospirillum canadense]